VILVDTNVLYALADRRDKHHTRCASWLQRTADVLMVPATVLAETCYLIDRTLGPVAEAAFLDSVGMGPDLRDFATVRPRHIPAFITVPGLD
jgi:predicted nucleic acid-binding protein